AVGRHRRTAPTRENTALGYSRQPGNDLGSALVWPGRRRPATAPEKTMKRWSHRPHRLRDGARPRARCGREEGRAVPDRGNTVLRKRWSSGEKRCSFGKERCCPGGHDDSARVAAGGRGTGGRARHETTSREPGPRQRG